MIVYFSGSARDISKKADLYSDILRGVHDAGGILAQSWVPAMILRGYPADLEWWELVSEEASRGIDDAGLVIVEASGQSTLGVGYEIAYALNHKKPTLLLIERGQENSSYAIGIQHSLLVKRIYELRSVKQDVTNEVKKIVEALE